MQRSIVARVAALSFAVLGIAGSAIPAGAANTFTTLHAFAGTDGLLPQGHLFYDYINSKAVIVGAAEAGGSGSSGTLYAYTLSTGVLSDLYSFMGSPDGQTPLGGVAVDLDKYDPVGQIVGTTAAGGQYFNGTLYRLPLNAAYSSVYSFGGVANANDKNSPLDGTSPSGVLAQATDGNFYGTTAAGGAGSSGTIFRYSPSNNSVSTIYTFANDPNVQDGATPLEGLTLSANKLLYGTTTSGGTYGNGTVYSLSTSGVVTTLYSFTGGNDGAAPQCLLAIDSNNDLYGTTPSGGSAGYGTIFEIDSNNHFKLLHTFTSNNYGETPNAGLAFGKNGVLYGTTSAGGNNQAGTIFSYDPSSSAFRKLHDFVPAKDGMDPESALLIGPNNTFFGTAIRGGANGFGTLYSFAP